MKTLFSNTITAALIIANCLILNSGEATRQSTPEVQVQTAAHSNVVKADKSLMILGLGLAIGMGVSLKAHQ